MISLAPSWLVVLALSLLGFRMIVSGFIVREGIFAWPMFSRMSMVTIHGTTAAGDAFNQWEYRMHADISNTRAGADLFMEYLSSAGVDISTGEMEVYDELGIHRYAIRHNVVAW